MTTGSLETLENLRCSRDGHVATLTIDRPKALNALDRQTLEELSTAFGEFESDPDVRAVVLTGGGEKAFCAGADIAAMKPLGASAAKHYARLGQGVTRQIEEARFPVIAAVNGWALGGGMEMVLACDLVLASAKARFGQPEIKLGILPGFGGTQRLVRRVGELRAREMIYLGDPIDAPTALAWGLANRVLDPETLATEAAGLAAKIAEQAPIGVAQCKRAISVASDVDMDSGLRFEAEAFGVAFASDDRLEGMSAFLEKRTATFKGS